MSREKQGSPGPRDTTLARLVADALESQSAIPSSAACPDADLLAAYADHALPDEEVSHWESHFADCARCQKVLAVLTVSSDDPLTQQEIARLGALVGKAAVPAESGASVPKAEKPTKRWVPWQWLVPAFGIAAAAVLWIALRPAIPHQQMTAERMAVPAPSDQQSQTAPAYVPPPPASASSAPLPNGEQQDLEREAPLSAKQNDGLRGAKKLVPARPALEADRLASALPKPAEPAGPAANKDAALPGPTASGNIAAPAAAPMHPSTQRAQAQSEAQAGSANAAPQPLNGRSVTALAKVAVPLSIFATPDRHTEWRIGPDGSIERSTDQGNTWQPQSSGVSTELLAGAAVTDKIAWIVGRADVILRTTDGEHWQRATRLPARPNTGRLDVPSSPSDLTGIEAPDAFHATVTSSDGARFATTDGGRTWTPQP